VGNTTGYANAVGNVQKPRRRPLAVFDVQYWNAEFYIKTGALTSRLTLDVGIRLYHQTPQSDLDKTFSISRSESVQKQIKEMPPSVYSGDWRWESIHSRASRPVTYIGLYVSE